jgi:hypothetical protein
LTASFEVDDGESTVAKRYAMSLVFVEPFPVGTPAGQGAGHSMKIVPVTATDESRDSTHQATLC